MLLASPLPRMPYQQDIEPISKKFTIVIGLTVVGFMAFGLALSFYRNVLFEETLRDLSKQNEEIAAGIQADYRDLDYFRSEQFLDKYAKENLGKINPGEQVLVITEPSVTQIKESTDEDGSLEAQKDAAWFELLNQMPVLEHWKLYLFHREQLDALKKGV